MQLHVLSAQLARVLQGCLCAELQNMSWPCYTAFPTLANISRSKMHISKLADGYYTLIIQSCTIQSMRETDLNKNAQINQIV